MRSCFPLNKFDTFSIVIEFLIVVTKNVWKCQVKICVSIREVVYLPLSAVAPKPINIAC